jgi:hypothetical protein
MSNPTLRAKVKSALEKGQTMAESALPPYIPPHALPGHAAGAACPGPHSIPTTSSRGRAVPHVKRNARIVTPSQ